MKEWENILTMVENKEAYFRSLTAQFVSYCSQTYLQRTGGMIPVTIFHNLMNQLQSNASFMQQLREEILSAMSKYGLLNEKPKSIGSSVSIPSGSLDIHVDSTFDYKPYGDAVSDTSLFPKHESIVTVLNGGNNEHAATDIVKKKRGRPKGSTKRVAHKLG